MRLSSGRPSVRASHVKKSKQESVRLFEQTPAVHLPFLEWSDKDIREENWLDPEWPTLDQDSYKLHHHDYVSGHHHDHPNTSESITDSEDMKRFRDQQTVYLPYSITEHEWKIASEVFPDAKLVVYLKSEVYPDLITDNKHLLHSEFMRNFISSIQTIIYLGNTTKFTSQFIAPNFNPTKGDKPWRPWFHIYSNHYAGTNHEHDPTINNIGKYVVRLYWLGTWRKIYVDDQLPVDLLNNVLLPSVAKTAEELEKSTDNLHYQEVVELWPYLLAKALLKIASLTWYKDREIVDFDIIHSLTGWFPQRINTKGLPISEIWDICWAYTNHYSYLSKIPCDEGEEHKSSQTTNSTIRLVKSSTKAATAKKGKKSSVDSNEENSEDSEEEQDEHEVHDLSRSVDKATTANCVVARCNDLRNFDDDQKIHNFSPCWSHEFLIDQTRDGPLAKPKLTEDLQNWKRIRWLSWAKKKGLVSEDEVRPENFHYRLVSAFRKVSDTVVYEQPSRITVGVLSLDLLLSKREKKAKKGKKNDFQSKVRIQEIAKKTPVKFKTETVPKIAPVKSTKSKELKPIVSDPSFWVDYKKLSSQINTITVYFKPSRMKTKIRISDLTEEGKWNIGKTNEWTILDNPLTPKECRNEPIYIFCESADPKILLINLAQTGYMKILEDKKEEKTLVPTAENIITECDFCLAALVKRIKAEITKEDLREYVSVTKFEPQPVIHERPCSHIVLEEYDWQTDELGKTVTSLNTYGTKTTTLEFGPGRTILKLWIKSDSSHVVYIFSDDLVEIGSLDTILSCMASESIIFENAYNVVANSFLKLVNAFGTPEFPVELKEFYKSYKPKEPLTKAESIALHDTFFELLAELVDFSMGVEERYALRLLLLRWDIKPVIVTLQDVKLCNCYEDDDLEYLKLLEKCVLRIQAYYRGTIERTLMKYQDPSFEYHNGMLDAVINISANVFSMDSRSTGCANIMRALLAHPDLDKMKEKYQYYRDLQNVLTLKQFIHNVKLVEGQWSPICRQQFFVNSNEPIPVKINLFCDFDQYVVRVIDNDTNTEIKRYTNNVAVSDYKSNGKGYTVLCYAWSSSSQKLTCKLCFATKKEVQQDILTIPRVSTEINSFYGMYKPNINNNICKYSVHLSSENALFSAHFTCSNPDAILNFKLFDDKGKLLQTVTGKGDVILPAITLEYREKRAKQRSSLISITSSKRKLKKHSTRHRSLQSPRSRSSILSVQNDFEHGSHVKLLEDETYHKHKRDSNGSDDSLELVSITRGHSRHSITSMGSGCRTSSRHSLHGRGRRRKYPDSHHSISSHESSRRSGHGSHHEEEEVDFTTRWGAKGNLTFRSFAAFYCHASTHRIVPDFSKIEAPPKTHKQPYCEPPPKAKPVKKKKETKIVSPTEYNIEVSVMDDSWPLSFEEWSNVEHPAPDSHHLNFISSMKEVVHRSSKVSKQSTSSIKSARKSASAFSKLVKLGIGSSISIGKRNQHPMEKPYWMMQTILNHGENVDIGRNPRRDIEMSCIKSKWAERDPGRAKRGHQLRAEFLRDVMIVNEGRPVAEDIYTKKSLIKEELSKYVLPPLDLTPYMNKDPREINDDDRIFKNSIALEKENRREAALIEEIDEKWRDAYDRLDEYANQQQMNLAIVNTWYNGVRRKSYRMMENAMNMKIAVYEDLTGRKFVPEIIDIEKKSKNRNYVSKVYT